MPNRRFALKNTIIFLFIGSTILVGYGFRNTFSPFVSPVVLKLQTMIGFGPPCSVPIKYSIDKFDERFGISETQFLNDLTKATNIWETIANKKLFEYSANNSKLKINLIYDNRQKATVEMQSIGATIEDKTSTYESMKRKYDSLAFAYDSKKGQLQSKVTQYNIAKEAYQQKVEYWNEKGGVTKQGFAELEQERIAVNALAKEVNSIQTELNDIGFRANAAASSLNQFAKDLNLDVKNYNTIGASTGEEFDEGEYIRDENGTYINIYQFEDNDKLIRVLTHEFGHSLGLGHVEDAKAIMYKLNQGYGISPTGADIDELNMICAIQK